MKIVGIMLVTACGGCIGICVSAVYRRKTAMLEAISDMLLSMSIKLEYGAPTVEDMLGEVCAETPELPNFMQAAPDRYAVIEALKKDPDFLDEADARKLIELLTSLGSADKDSELQRLRSAREYFLRRADTERPKNEKHAELARKLGILCGIFAAIMLL